jgi:predicted transcriptional regulator
MADVFRSTRSGPAAVLGPLEAEIMQVVWKADHPLPVSEVHRTLSEGGRSISYSAIKTVLNILANKGRLAKTRAGKATFFAATASEDEFEAQVLSAVVRSLKGNLGPAVIAQLVDELAVDAETLAEFERLIAQRKSELKS